MNLKDRLRDIAAYDCCSQREEAADEIERLEADLAKAREDTLWEAAELAYAYIVDRNLPYQHRTALPMEIRALKEKKP